MKQENRRKNGMGRRVLALLAAVLLLGAFLVPAFLPEGAPAVHAETAFKTLQKGGSGAQVKRAQQALKELGYYSGKIDGNFSKAFEEAVKAFQKDFDLEVTGKIDEETYLFITADLPEEEATPAPVQKTAATPKPTAAPKANATNPDLPEEEPIVVVFGQDYSDKDHVAWYIHTFGELPPNYITKAEAQELGWVSSKGNLWQVAPGKSIGGDRFGNYEKLLPTAKGRTYTECDIDYELDREEYRGGRNGKRIIFSNDGLVFYTDDHYETFTEITFEENP